MLDLFNLNIGGGSGFGGDRTYRAKGYGNDAGVTRVNLPRPVDTDEKKFAKRIVGLFNIASFDYYGVAAALWDNAPDGVKIHLYSLADALVEVAADKHERGLDYTMVEREIGTTASLFRRHLSVTGWTETPDPEPVDEGDEDDGQDALAQLRGILDA